MSREPEQIVWQGKYVTAKRRGRWEYVSRSRGIRAAVILATEEETGYRAATLADCGEFYSSPGMVTESFTLVRATGLTKVGDGGGTDSEDIVVHRVALAELPAFVDSKRAEGVAIDVRLLMLLGAEIVGEDA